MNSGGQIPWNAVAICEMSKIFLQTGKPVWTKIWGIIQRTNYSIRCTSGISPKLQERQSENPSIRKESITRNFHGFALIAGIWRSADIEELEKLDASEIYPRTLNAKEVMISQKNGEFIFPVADGSAKLSGRDYEFQEPTMRQESTVRRENLSGESQSDREEFRPEEIKRWRRNSQGLLVHSRWFHLSSSCWTESSFVCAERRIIPNSTEVYWRQQVNSYRSGCCTRKRIATIGMSRETEVCQIHGQVSQDLDYWTKLLQKDTCGLGGDSQKIKRHHVQITYGLTLGRELEKPLKRREK